VISSAVLLSPSRRRHTRSKRDWSSDVCSSDLQGYADISMGIGLIIAGLASVIVGQALIPSRLVFWATTAVLVGSVAYRLAIQVALELGLEANDMKLISALLVSIALLLRRWAPLRRL